MSHEFGHGGTMTGYAAQLTVSEQDGFDNGPKVAVVVLTNGDGANPEPLLRLALAAGRVDANGRERITFADQAPLPTRTLASADAQAFTGTYRNPKRFTVEVVRQGASLVLKRFGRDFPMRALERDGEFMVDLPRGGSELIVFGRTASGAVDYMQMNVWALARGCVTAAPPLTAGILVHVRTPSCRERALSAGECARARPRTAARANRCAASLSQSFVTGPRGLAASTAGIGLTAGACGRTPGGGRAVHDRPGVPARQWHLRRARTPRGAISVALDHDARAGSRDRGAAG
jgi:hypothetical protein